MSTGLGPMRHMNEIATPAFTKEFRSCTGSRRVGTLGILRIPFFLDLQRDASAEGYKGRAAMIERYFRERASINSETKWALLAKCSFDSYRMFKSRSFEKSFWEESIGLDTVSDLERSGILVGADSTVDVGRMRFRHQLLHDYLVGRYMSTAAASTWGPDLFDAATFRANSNESLAFAVEILGPNLGDAFVTEVYDWNYISSFQCIADVRRSVRGASVSDDLRYALAALLAEKRFDFFAETALSASATLGRMSSADADALRRAEDLRALFEEVRTRPESVEARYAKWRALFLRADGIASEVDMALLDGDPLIGWTAANVLRRLEVGAELQPILRHVYRSNIDRPSHRWRAVHVLGRFPSAENIALLWSAALEDPSTWVQYGAVRSLMEIAYLDSGQRVAILERFRSELPKLDAQTENEVPILLRELGRCCLISQANDETGSWYSQVLPLAEAAATLPGAQQEEKSWRERIAKIRKYLETQ